MQVVTTQKKALQKAEWTSCAISESTELSALKTAFGAKPIKDITAEELKQTLRYCMVLTGIRAQNIPVDEEKVVLMHFIYKYFGKYTIAEMKLAFELAIARQLPLEEKELKCYDNFSSEYVSRIMKAYRSYANMIIENAAEKVIIPKKLAPANYSSLELVNMYYTEFLEGTINWKIVSDKAYEIAYNEGVIVYDERQVKQAIEAAKSETLATYYAKQKKDEYKALKDIPLESVCNNADVNHLVRIKLLKLWFEQLKKDRVKIIVK